MFWSYSLKAWLPSPFSIDAPPFPLLFAPMCIYEGHVSIYSMKGQGSLVIER